MKQLGRVKFFAADKGFGFVTCRDIDVFVHQSACKNTVLKEGGWVVCAYEPSHKYLSKYTATAVTSVMDEKDYFKASFEALSEPERKMLFPTFPGLINEIINSYVNDNVLKQIQNEVKKHLNTFDLNQVVASITGKIVVYHKKKFDGDDSFDAAISVTAAKTEDPYIDTIMPNHYEVTYFDGGYYSCYDMERDYNRIRRSEDEARLPNLVEVVKRNYVSAYNKDEHYNHLVNIRIDLFKQRVRRDLYSIGTTKAEWL